MPRHSRIRMTWWRLQQWWWNLVYPVSEEDQQADYAAIRHELWKEEHGWSTPRTVDAGYKERTDA